MSTPNCFIVGAPKCGTTSLSEYLRGHPEIFVSDPKEPFYFCSDMPGLSKVRDEGDYLELFRAAQARHVVISEASAIYLFSEVACQRIHDFDQNARIIVMLRNPVDLLPSYHAQQLFSLNEDVCDFARAWALQDERAKGLSVPRVCKDPKVLQYHGIGRLGAQVERLLSIFPREQICFVTFDEFSTSTAAVYQRVLRFLGVRDDGKQDFPRLNQHKTHRFAAAEFARRAVVGRPLIHQALKRGLTRLGFVTALRSAIRTTRPRPPLDPEIREMLRLTFADDVQLLSALIKQDLTHWTTPTRAAA